MYKGTYSLLSQFVNNLQDYQNLSSQARCQLPKYFCKTQLCSFISVLERLNGKCNNGKIIYVYVPLFRGLNLLYPTSHSSHIQYKPQGGEEPAVSSSLHASSTTSAKPRGRSFAKPGQRRRSVQTRHGSLSMHGMGRLWGESPPLKLGVLALQLWQGVRSDGRRKRRQEY